MSQLMIIEVPKVVAEVEASAKNGPSSMLVGGAGYRCSGLAETKANVK